MATGMGGEIAVIDTERGRACQYAGDFTFRHEVLEAPFSPKRYCEILEAAYSINPNVIIIDSMSHVWEGIGGVLDVVDQAKQSGRTDIGIWAQPKQEHQRLVNLMLQSPAHLIMCFRAKEKRGLVPDPRRPGKTEIVNLGWHPIAESSVTYELTVNVLLSSDNKGVPIVDGFDFGKLPYNMKHLMPAGETISETTGKMFAEWANGAPAPVRRTAGELLKQIENCDDAGVLELLDEELQTMLPKVRDTAKERLTEAMTAAVDRLAVV
jgi:hypothetical protein